VLEFPLPDSCLFFLHFLLPCNILFLLWLFFAIGSIHLEAQVVKFNCSCTSGFTDCSCTSGFTDFSCPSGFTDCSCLLPISSSIVSCTSGLLRLQLSSSIFLSSIVNCTSGILRLQLFSTVFEISSSTGFFPEIYFGYRYLII
jgi:hypothetical protein